MAGAGSRRAESKQEVGWGCRTVTLSPVMHFLQQGRTFPNSHQGTNYQLPEPIGSTHYSNLHTYWLSYFSIAEIKHQDQGNLFFFKVFNLAYGFRVFKSMMAEQEKNSWELTCSSTSTRQRVLEISWVFLFVCFVFFLSLWACPHPSDRPGIKPRFQILLNTF